MPRYKVSALADFEVSAPDQDTAEGIIRASLKNLALPTTATVPSPISPPSNLDITSRLIAPPDLRLLAHIPNLSPSELRTQVAAMTDTEEAILSWCAIQPFSMHNIIRLIQRQAATYSTHSKVSADDIRRAAVRLQNRGWLTTVHHNIQQDTFTDARLEGVRALFSHTAHTTHTGGTQ